MPSGEREWYSLYEFIEIIRIPELLDFYRSIGMPLTKYLACKNFSLRNFTNYLVKILFGGKKRGLHYINLKKKCTFKFIFSKCLFFNSLLFVKKFKKINKKICMNIFLTGGSGFIGSSFIKEASKKNILIFF